MPLRPGPGFGDPLSVVPSPSCPSQLPPHDQTVPSGSSAEREGVASGHVGHTGDTLGPHWLVHLGTPSSPLPSERDEFSPQPQTEPSSSTAKVL